MVDFPLRVKMPIYCLNTSSGFPSQKKNELTTVSKDPIFDLINLTNHQKINPTSAARFLVVQSNRRSCIHCSLKEFWGILLLFWLKIKTCLLLTRSNNWLLYCVERAFFGDNVLCMSTVTGRQRHPLCPNRLADLKKVLEVFLTLFATSQTTISIFLFGRE